MFIYGPQCGILCNIAADDGDDDNDDDDDDYMIIPTLLRCTMKLPAVKLRRQEN